MMMVDALLGLYMASSISALHFCTICYWAGKAGVAVASEYGLSLGKPSGHYQRHLNDALGFSAARQTKYNLTFPGKKRGEMARTPITIPCRPAHEVAHDRVKNDPSASTRLMEAIDNRDLPESYFQHPLVRTSADLIMPWGLYMDSVPYSLTDSVLGCWLINLVTGSRDLICLVRKQLVCACSCKGWCSYHALLIWLHWCFASLSAGAFPNTRHDGKGWESVDDERRSLAGQPMKMKGILLRIKGDWEEFCSRLGFPTWGSVVRPCFMCNGSGSFLYQCAGVHILGLPWRLNEDDDYDQACARCEIRVRVTEPIRRAILKELHYDKRNKGAKGRALRNAVPIAGLRANDRLEPTATLIDVGEFDTMALPAAVIFWRSENETICTHRCPLFDRSLGITPTSTISLDLLHALYLGPMQAWCKYVVWLLLSIGIWAPNEQTEGEKLQVGIMGFRYELQRWYESWSTEHPTESLTRLSNITPKMLGTKDSKKMKTKAAETFGLLRFLVDMLQKYSGSIGDAAASLIESGRCLIRYIEILRASPMRLPMSVRQDSTNTTNTKRSCKHKKHRSDGKG